MDNVGHDVCDSCYDRVTHSWDGTTEAQAVNENLTSMKFGDYATVLLISAIVAVAVCSEIEDVSICRFMRFGTFSQQEGEAQVWTARGWSAWHVPLLVLENLRQFCLLPLTCLAVPWLILYKGADSLTICLNGLAVLFILVRRHARKPA